MKKKLVARAIAGAGLVVCSLVATANPALAQTITSSACTSGGGTIVDHGAWLGCRGISPHDIKIVD